MSSMLSRPAAQGVLLLCLDAAAPAADCDATAIAPHQPWQANAARLLAHARAEGWAVGHVMQRRRRPGETPWRPAAGLSPLPQEPIYHRDQPSAFTSSELCAALDQPLQPEVVLCGLSVHGSGLATALDAQRRRVQLTLASDSVWLAPSEQPGMDGLMRLQRLGYLPRRVRLADTETLMRPWRFLRLVKGGQG